MARAIKRQAEWNAPADWSDWNNWLAAGLHGRNRWRLAVVLSGMLFAQGRRTVTTWLRAAGIGVDFASYYYFLSAVGRKTSELADRLLILLLRVISCGRTILVALDDSPTKRYGPKVQGAGIHHNPTPGPTDQAFLYGHVWVVIAWIARHPTWGWIGLPLRALLYIRQCDVPKLPRKYKWKFQTKLVLGVQLVEWAAEIIHAAGKRLRVVADGFYAKRPFLRPLIADGITVVSRLRKDAALRDVPAPPRRGQPRGPGRPRIYGKQKFSLAKRAGSRGGWQTAWCEAYGQQVLKTFKTFLATYRPTGGVIRVVIVQEEHGCEFFFSTDASLSAVEIIETFAARAPIEQCFHDLKEVWGWGQQQLRNLWANIGATHLILWMQTLVEAWAWPKAKEQICDRSDSPWDDPDRRPSHADRRKALRRNWLAREFSARAARWPIPQKLRHLILFLTHLTT